MYVFIRGDTTCHHGSSKQVTVSQDFMQIMKDNIQPSDGTSDCHMPTIFFLWSTT